MMIHIPTMMVVIILMSLTLCLAIGWVTPREDRDGLQVMTYALAVHGLAYILFALRDRIPDVFSIWLANVAISGTYVLLIYAVVQFQRRTIARLVLWSPLLVTGLAFGLLMSNLNARIVAGSVILAILDLTLLYYLFGASQKTAGKGQYLLISGVLLNLLIMLFRAVMILTGEEHPLHITDSSISQSLVYLSAFISLNLVAIGFVLMTKEYADEKTRLMAMTDRLTSCWNRFRVEETAHQEMLRLQKRGTPVSLIILDLDFFKPINDQFGHIIGDAVLKGVSDTVRTCIRSTDILGRWGGEEFVVLLPATSFFVAAHIAERIREAVAKQVYEHGIRMTTSIGLSCCQSTDTWSDWLNRADVALYRAKANGRNQVVSEMPIAVSPDVLPLEHGLIQMVWSKKYETGCQKIDAQHRQMFDLSNQLLDAMLNKTPKEALIKQTRDFIDFMTEHMQAEEVLLSPLNLPEAAAHFELHRHLQERSHLLLERYSHNLLEIGELLHFVMFEVTAQHILVEDQKFDAYFQALP